MNNRRLSRWVAIAIGLLIICDLAPTYSIDWAIQHYHVETDPSALKDLRTVQLFARTLMLLYVMGMCAAFRLPAKHPAMDKRYLNWLRTTPWTAKDPLPFIYPLSLRWFDLIWIGAFLCIIHFRTAVSALSAFNVFMVVYLLVGFLVIGAGVNKWSIPMLIGFICLFRFWTYHYVALGIVLLMYGVYVIALRKSMDWCEWPPVEREKLPELGWPFQYVGPERPRASVPALKALFIALLAGWCLYCVTWRGGLETGGAAVILLMEALFIPLIRLAIYISNRQPPLNGIVARFRAGRVLIPRYDQIYVAPACVALAMIPMIIWTVGFGPPAPMAAALGTALCLFLALAVGPSWRAWDLTGEYRYRRTGASRRLRARGRD